MDISGPFLLCAHDALHQTLLGPWLTGHCRFRTWGYLFIQDLESLLSHPDLRVLLLSQSLRCFWSDRVEAGGRKIA